MLWMYLKLLTQNKKKKKENALSRAVFTQKRYAKNVR